MILLLSSWVVNCYLLGQGLEYIMTLSGLLIIGKGDVY
jgi:hypothetical protein